MVSVLGSNKAVWVQALTVATVLHVFLGKTITVPLSTEVYKWAPANLVLG